MGTKTSEVIFFNRTKNRSISLFLINDLDDKYCQQITLEYKFVGGGIFLIKWGYKKINHHFVVVESKGDNINYLDAEFNLSNLPQNIKKEYVGGSRKKAAGIMVDKIRRVCVALAMDMSAIELVLEQKILAPFLKKKQKNKS